jgi:MYXO-CTERM domain-containing protein
MVARVFRAAVLALAAGVWALPASAQVFQTDAVMTPLPQPVGVDEVRLATESWAYNRATQVNRDAMGMNVNGMTFGDYYPTFVDGDAITLAGLFKFRGENIDPVKDAKTTPGYFSPSCGFAGEIVLRGGDCEITFGWYNVDDPNSTTPPAQEEIYQFLPTAMSTLTLDLQCQAPLNNGFCPLAWDNVDPRQLDKKLWMRRAFDSGAIKEDPRYKGKYVAFAVRGKEGTKCTATKFSMQGHNTKNSSGTPWVTAIIYQSTIDPEGFYMAFEDLPMLPADWKQTGVGSATNDGDFNDFVFYVSGISCLGGGQPCTVPDQTGACALGRTDCALEGATGMCRPITPAQTEKCDNLDNDCNGSVDDGEGLCTGSQVCDKGTCVDACGTGEFRCDPKFTCKAGHCIPDDCAEVVCDQGQICRAGVCKAPCESVICPSGQECQLGRCVDPCANVTCTAGKVCERGLCVSDCSCRGCAEGLECAADGRCVDPKCVGVMCAATERCEAGACVDACVGVICEDGAACVNGACIQGSGGSDSGTAGSLNFAGALNLGGSNGNGGANGSGASSGKRRESEAPGCACEVAGGRATNAALLLGLVGLGVAVARRRRRAA